VIDDFCTASLSETAVKRRLADGVDDADLVMRRETVAV
jgi:hypothetical protein